MSDNKPLDKTIQTAAEKRGSMPWAARLKRVFNIDMNVCEACGGGVRWWLGSEIYLQRRK